MARVVVLSAVPEGYAVDVSPPFPDGLDRSCTFATKIGAWSYAQGLWTDHGLGLRDLTDGNTGNYNAGSKHRE